MNNLATNEVDTMDLMTDEDKELFQFLMNLRFHINKFIDIDIIIDKIKSLIDESEHFNFSNRITKNYISKEKPVFSLVYNITFPEPEFPEKDSYSRRFNIVKKFLDKEILSPFSEFITVSIRNQENNEIFNDENIKKHFSSKNKNLLQFVFTSIFGINFSKQSNIIYLQYMK